MDESRSLCHAMPNSTYWTIARDLNVWDLRDVLKR
jgi:hypothetical protein